MKNECNARKESLKSQDDPCASYKVMAFIIPFLAVTLSGVICKSHSVIIAPTIGLLAGATGFGLYSAIKFLVRSLRSVLAFEHEQVKIAERWQ